MNEKITSSLEECCRPRYVLNSYLLRFFFKSSLVIWPHLSGTCAKRYCYTTRNIKLLLQSLTIGSTSPWHCKIGMFRLTLFAKDTLSCKGIQQLSARIPARGFSYVIPEYKARAPPGNKCTVYILYSTKKAVLSYYITLRKATKHDFVGWNSSFFFSAEY